MTTAIDEIKCLYRSINATNTSLTHIAEAEYFLLQYLALL